MEEINHLIENFIEQAKIYCETIPEGDYKRGNLADKKLSKIFNKIKLLSGTKKLKEYINHDDEGIRFCVTSTLITIYPDECIPILEEMIEKKSLFGLLAMGVVDLWKQGKL